MSDPFSWSVSLGRLFGIQIRVHLLFPLVALGLILRVAFNDKDFPLPHTWLDAAMVIGLLFFAVVLHEFGHCFGARWVDGDAHQILIWPLGGLAAIDVPHTPRAHFIASAAGPAMNLLICLVAGTAFLYVTDFKLRLPWNPLAGGEYGWYPYRVVADTYGSIRLYDWAGHEHLEGRLAAIVLARLFWVSWLLFVFNMVLVGFPMDAGRMFQCLLWPRWGFRASMQAAIYAGFLTAVVLAIAAMAFNEVLPFFLGIFIYVTCRNQWILLETGGEESVFGYDFSQGYTSLERDQPQSSPRRRRPNFWQRWLQRRAQQRMQREQEQREAEERRMDELLEKVQRHGQHSLTDEEMRFLKRVSLKYRNRQ